MTAEVTTVCRAVMLVTATQKAGDNEGDGESVRVIVLRVIAYTCYFAYLPYRLRGTIYLLEIQRQVPVRRFNDFP